MSRVLLAGVAVAGVAATTSAFTNSNTNSAPGDKVAGYGEVAVSGVTVTNIAYTPLGTDATKLDNIIFTVTEDATDMNALLTVTTSGTSGTLNPTTCGAWTEGTITCDVANTVVIQEVTKVGLTVTSK